MDESEKKEFMKDFEKEQFLGDTKTTTLIYEKLREFIMFSSSGAPKESMLAIIWLISGMIPLNAQQNEVSLDDELQKTFRAITQHSRLTELNLKNKESK